jgi:excisionase family DNA binding protein
MGRKPAMAVTIDPDALADVIAEKLLMRIERKFGDRLQPKDPDIGPRLLTLQQVADALGTSTHFVRKAIREGKLKVVKVGDLPRVRPEELDRFVG